MIKQTIRMLFAFLCLAQCSQAQTEEVVETDEYKNTISIQAGYHQAFVKDVNFSPLNLAESGLIYRGAYERNNSKSLFGFRAGYSAGISENEKMIYTDQKDDGTLFIAGPDYILGDVAIQYLLKSQKLSGDKLDVFIGGQYQFFIYYLNFGNQDAFSFLANHAIEFSGKLYYNLGEKHQLSASLEIPVISLVVRPPYSNADEELFYNFDNGKTFALITDGEWGSFNKLVSYKFGLNYAYALSPRFDMLASYQNRYYRTFDTNPVISFMNEFFVGVNFKF